MLPTAAIDAFDARLIHALAESPRMAVLELARQLGVARGTVQARLEKLQRRGVITGFGPDVATRGLGYDVLAFATLEIAQGRLQDVVAHLRDIPEVLEAHATSGPGDLHCRVVARSNEHLQQVINRILEVQGIGRITTVLALSEQISYRVMPLVGAAAAPAPGPGGNPAGVGGSGV
jgi:DNA-binding Lrp family transcriptional regulator